MMLEEAQSALCVLAEPDRARDMARRHRVARRYLGVPGPELDALATRWRRTLDIGQRVTLARGLWNSDTHEARIAAAKLLTQARIRPDDEVWFQIASWVPQLDGWAISDHVCSAAGRRLLACPDRLDQVDLWTGSASVWMRRAALVMTLPWAKMTHPSADDLAMRDRILGWAAACVEDPDQFIQNAVAGWLCTLSRHDPERARTFLSAHAARMSPAARKTTARLLPQ